MSRRRFRYDPALREVVEVSSDWSDAETRAPVTTEALVYGSLGTATDGTPIDSRSKHRAYMKANDLVLLSDCTESNARAAAKREAFFAGKHEHAGLKQAIGRAVDAARRRR